MLAFGLGTFPAMLMMAAPAGCSPSLAATWCAVARHLYLLLGWSQSAAALLPFAAHTTVMPQLIPMMRTFRMTAPGDRSCSQFLLP